MNQSEGYPTCNYLKRMLNALTGAVFLLSFGISFSFAESGYSQGAETKISLHLKATPIKEVCRQIERKSNFIFAFSDNADKELNRRVDIQVDSMSVRNILSRVLVNTGLQYRISDKQIVVYKPVTTATASEKRSNLLASHLTQEVNNKQITGRVVDKSGAPVAGANIQVKGLPNLHAVTDANGNFNLSDVPENSVLVVSFVGYATIEYPLKGETQINVTLQEKTTSLDDVVIVGYGQTKRRDLTTAQTSISSEAINKTVNTTIDQAIQGRAAGVMVTTNSAQPGGSISVNVRGISSLSGTNEPLYVIDGIQIQPDLPGFGNQSSLNPLASLNPSDVENIEILEGPSATAIYGSRATNGVVLITTKRGKPGATKIEYNFQYSLQDRPKEIPTTNLKEFTIMSNELRRYMNDVIPEFQRDSSILGPGTNWQKEIFRRAPLSKHQLSFSGGSDRLTYYLSGERFQQEGAILGSGFDRTGIRLNIDNKANDWLRLGLNFNVSQTNDDVTTTVSDGVRYAFMLPPYISAKNPDGSYGGYPADQVQYHNEDLNPLARAELETHTSKRNNYNGGFNMTLFLLRGLQFRSSLNANMSNTNNIDFIPTYKIGAVTKSKADMGEYMSQSFGWNWNQLLEYKIDFRNAHHFILMTSHESQEGNWKGINGLRTGFPVNEMPGGQLPSIGLGDPNGQVTGGYKGWWAQESYLGRLNYNFRDKYLLTATYRADGSVNFGKDKRWGHFPSVSAAWRVSAEPFFTPLKNIINDFKLRIETGATGNQGSGAGIFAPLRPVASPWGNGFLVSKYGNPDLQWESTVTQNIGFNLSLFQNRISLEGDFYVRKTDNLLMNNPLPFYMGTEGADAIQSPTVNIGALSNRGWAFTLSTVNVAGKNVTWTSNFNISHNKSRIDRFYQETAVVDMTNWKAPGGFIQRSAVGREAWQFLGYRSDGMFKTLDELTNGPLPQNGATENTVGIGKDGIWIGDYRYVDVDGNGRISPLDMTYIGNPYPKFTFGFSNNVSWKNLSLSVLMIGSQGNQIYNAFKQGHLNPAFVYEYGNVLRESYEAYARIGIDKSGDPCLINPEASVARYAGANSNWSRSSDRFVEDGSYLRVKNLSLSYELPAHIMNKTKYVHSLRFTLGVQNLYTFTHYSGFDPEVGLDVGHDSDVSRRTFGVDVGQYPQVRSYLLNVKVGF